VKGMIGDCKRPARMYSKDGDIDMFVELFKSVDL